MSVRKTITYIVQTIHMYTSCTITNNNHCFICHFKISNKNSIKKRMFEILLSYKITFVRESFNRFDCNYEKS